MTISQNIKKNSFPYIVLLIILFKFAITLVTGVHEDEGYYWDWSRNLSVGYFDHPPMVAWIIGFFRIIFGDGITAVKLADATIALFTFSAIFMVGKDIADKYKSLFVTSLIMFGSPVFAILTSFMSPDIPLFLFWSLSILLGYKLLEKDDSGYIIWILFGIVLSLGMYSKYTFILFPPSFALAMLITRKDLLKTIKPYLAVLIAIIVFIPHIIWNINHDWPSLTFQLKHGLEASGYRIKYIGEFITSQIALFNPLLFIIMVTAIVKIIKEEKKSPGMVLVTIVTIIPLLFFGYASLKKRGNANWPATAFIGGTLLIIWIYANSNKRYKKFIKISLISSLILQSVMTVQMIKPIIPIQSVINRLFGWEEFSKGIENIIEVNKKSDVKIFVNNYQLAGTIALFMPKHPKIYALNINSRSNQYTLSKKRNSQLSGQSIFIHEVNKNNAIPDLIKKAFSKIELLGTVKLKQGTRIKNFGVFEVTDIKKEALN